MGEPTWQEITAEAIRRKAQALKDGRGDIELEALIVEITREGWKPPEPEPVDPDILAFREWAGDHRPIHKEAILEGVWDHGVSATAYRAGARMAREQFAPREREMLAVLEEFSRDCDGYLDGDGHPWALLQRARDIIAKHNETAR